MTIDLTLNKRSKIASYRALLQMFVDSGFSFFTHAHFFEHGAFDGKAMYLRHDADRNIEIALLMARIEREMGIQSTYYLLPPGDYGQSENYYGAIVGDRLVPSARLKEVVLEIASLGHEIGLHNDFVQLSEKMGRRVEDVVTEQIAYFKGIGIEIKGTASHGSEFVKGHGFVNYQIFSECKTAKSVERTLTLSGGRTLELFGISFKQLGLTYEAYSIKRDTYLSDSSGIFSVNKQAFEDEVDMLPLKAALVESKSAIALIHPDWWIDPSAKTVVHTPGGRKKTLSARLLKNVRKLFPFGRKTREMQKQLQSLRQRNEKLADSVLVLERSQVSLREKLAEQKERLTGSVLVLECSQASLREKLSEQKIKLTDSVAIFEQSRASLREELSQQEKKITELSAKPKMLSSIRGDVQCDASFGDAGMILNVNSTKKNAEANKIVTLDFPVPTGHLGNGTIFFEACSIGAQGDVKGNYCQLAVAFYNADGALLGDVSKQQIFASDDAVGYCFTHVIPGDASSVELEFHQDKIFHKRLTISRIGMMHAGGVFLYKKNGSSKIANDAAWRDVMRGGDAEMVKKISSHFDSPAKPSLVVPPVSEAATSL
jgi:hypothetical protein